MLPRQVLQLNTALPGNVCIFYIFLKTEFKEQQEFPRKQAVERLSQFFFVNKGHNLIIKIINFDQNKIKREKKQAI